MALLLPDLEAAGSQGLGVGNARSNLVREVARHAPDLVICDGALPDEALFKATLPTPRFDFALTIPMRWRISETRAPAQDGDKRV